MPPQVAISGAFDNPASRSVRFLQEAARLGDVSVLLWSDDAVRADTGQPSKFPQRERLYFLQALRYVGRVVPLSGAVVANELPHVPGLKTDIWAEEQARDDQRKQDFCVRHGLQYRVFRDEDLRGFPNSAAPQTPAEAARKKVVVTGSFDWLHSGHVRFFEEAATYGDLYVVVGHDDNIRLLKGEGHPLFPQEERRYLVQSVRFVTQALISTGHGWLDAEPEIAQIKPDIYAVNEDGDKGGKREFCRQRGIEYLVLKRAPAPGLPGRSSTDLRGF